ncbi:MAG: GNAT family N-acetyltransferase, partial [Pseudomonadota bacterium]
MTLRIRVCQDPPAQDSLDPLLRQYYTLIVERMAAIGVPVDPETPRSALAEFWVNIDAYLPPRGCLVVAETETGELVGC